MVPADRDSTLRRFGWRLLAPAIGSKFGGWVSERVVKIGMRGLGVNVGYGLAESGETWLVPRVLAACPAAICADVGANVGKYSRLLVRNGAARVFAFEAVPSTFSKLAAAMARYDNVTTILSAIGERNGSVAMHLPHNADQSALASRDAQVAGLRDESFLACTVDMTTLDAFTEANNVQFDFIKIDVEGFELEVLRGARRLLQEKRLAVLQVEFNRHHMLRRQHMGDFADALPGYRLFRLTPRSLFPIRRGHYLSTIYTFQNLVAVREDRPEVLRGLGN
jgi:FkbM family methyltransferase